MYIFVWKGTNCVIYIFAGKVAGKASKLFSWLGPMVGMPLLAYELAWLNNDFMLCMVLQRILLVLVCLRLLSWLCNTAATYILVALIFRQNFLISILAEIVGCILPIFFWMN